MLRTPKLLYPKYHPKAMTESTGGGERLAVGQLLARLLSEFRRDILEPVAGTEFDDVREAHLQIFGNIRMGGVRLTELAARAQLSLAATSELVNDLVRLGYLEREPDPTDGRAKLIQLTDRGTTLMALAGHRVVDMEERWADHVGRRRFADMTATMQDLLAELNPDAARG